MNKNVDDINPKTTSYKSVSRIADLLQCIINDLNTVTEIANYCNLSKSTVSRMLKTLSDSNIVVQNPFNRRFYLGRLIAQCSANPFITHKYLVVSSLKEMLRLKKLSGETVFISILIGIQYMNLHQISSDHALNIQPDGKMRGPLLSGATAKVLFSQVSDENLDLALKYLNIDGSNNSLTIINKDTLNKKLMQVKQQGYIISYGETLPGILGISAPIRNYTCPAALSILGPESRFRPKINSLIEELKISTNKISTIIAGLSKEE